MLIAARVVDNSRGVVFLLFFPRSFHDVQFVCSDPHEALLGARGRLLGARGRAAVRRSVSTECLALLRGVVARLFKKMPQPCRLIGLEVHFNLDLRVRGAKGHQILGIEDVVFAPLAVNFKHGRPFCRNLTQAMPCQGLFVEGEPRHRPARRSASVVVHLDRAVEAFVHVVLVAELVVGAHAGNKVVFSRRAQPLAPVALTADP